MCVTAAHIPTETVSVQPVTTVQRKGDGLSSTGCRDMLSHTPPSDAPPLSVLTCSLAFGTRLVALRTIDTASTTRAGQLLSGTVTGCIYGWAGAVLSYKREARRGI